MPWYRFVAGRRFQVQPESAADRGPVIGGYPVRMRDSPPSPREFWAVVRAIGADGTRAVPGRARAGADGSPGQPGMRSAVLKPVRWWAGPLLLAAAALTFDAAKRRIPFGVWTTGPVDEVAHLSTAALGLLVLARFIDVPRRFYVAALIASVAIDVDHIPPYLGLGDPAQRPVTHSLSTVAVFAAAATASRRHRAVLAGTATGLVLHFARDIAEDHPGVRVFWPLQDTSWAVNYRWWFLGMIVVITAARLGLARAGLPRNRIPLFQAPSPAGSILSFWDGPATSGDRSLGLEPPRPDLEAAREARSRTSLRSPPRSCRWQGCGRQTDLVLP